MQITSRLTATRLSRVEPGDLFIFNDNNDSSGDRCQGSGEESGYQLVLMLGPISQTRTELPVLTDLPRSTPVVPFSKDYTVSLPCDPKGWVFSEPKAGTCVVLSRETLYIRARFGFADEFTQTYVRIKDGSVCANDAGQFAPPPSDCAYATELTFSTAEKEPRIILSLK